MPSHSVSGGTRPCSKIFVKKAARAFLVAHGLRREALTSAAPHVRAEEWAFARNESGRPEVCYPASSCCLRFSISHKAGMVACLVTIGIDCGVDVELSAPLPDLEVLCQLTLAPSERALVAGLAENERSMHSCGFGH